MRKLIYTFALLLFTSISAYAVTVSTSGTTSICPGASASISALASGGTGPYSYLWMPGSLSGTTVTVTPSSTTTYTVTAMDGVGATATGTVTITVLPLPTVAFTSPTTSGCEPFCTNFTDLSTISSGTITSWNWYFGDGTNSTNQNPPTHCYNSAGMYDIFLTATSSGGCSSTMTIPNYITVYANPIANFSTAHTPPYTINFTDLSIGAGGSWTWDFGDGNFSSLPNPVHTYASPGNYVVTLTVQNSFGCADTITLLVVITGINEYYLNNLVSISPNPLSTSAIIELKNTKLNLQNPNLILFDVLGKEVKKIELDNYKTTIEKEDLNTGIYFYKVMNENQIISTGKLSVE